MATLHLFARRRLRQLSSLAPCALLAAVMGCPQTPGTSFSLNGVGANNVQPTAQPPAATFAPLILLTPAPRRTEPTPNNGTPVPSAFFATSGSTPVPTPTPTLEALDFQIDEGQGNSNYAQNLFIVPAVGDLPHLDPPASRSYSAVADLGIGPSLAAKDGVAQ
ncbi:MAG: hypothetical protein KGR26_07580, partial [Cyanobacteria bacterium REEB65]|nr:hypothetical protein [Cyanobacteria bacterium REEB65]